MPKYAYLKSEFLVFFCNVILVTAVLRPFYKMIVCIFTYSLYAISCDACGVCDELLVSSDRFWLILALLMWKLDADCRTPIYPKHAHLFG